ncbi:hypothetical protein D7D52_04375 [Nocardia yunnanensis]|uniref:Uncharacterized protein n=1 Tax=Nocardia yunnanensis TaxID=2382165 RepID=A0A386Z7Z9_9NOCA|nr:hypothetical protein [Nocardia yunnanensis]AYF73224.1 hypothetical protein D7D52_04375 [Nocardia yunnanensis]
MTLRERLNELPALGGAMVYGEPHQTADGSTIITVAAVSPRWGARPVGVFVVREGEVTWEAAMDASHIALLGVLTGLLAATLGTLAVVISPPWPNMRFWDIRYRTS